jgi:transcriptional regulator
MLYNPPAFREDDLARLHDHIAANGFATLITVGEGGPIVSHLPLLIEREAGTRGTLVGHLARANPQWRDSDLSKPALAVFLGLDAYVSPSWYPSKQKHGKVVPTWNYSVVHAGGMLEFFEEPERLAEVVQKLTERHEARFARPWQVSDAPADFVQAQLRAIVGFRLRIDTLEGKMKLSQNRPEFDQLGVIAGLRASDRPGDRDMAQKMTQRRDAKSS